MCAFAWERQGLLCFGPLPCFPECGPGPDARGPRGPSVILASCQGRRAHGHCATAEVGGTILQVLVARACNLAPGVPDFCVPHSASAAATPRSASYASSSGSVSSCGLCYRCVLERTQPGRVCLQTRQQGHSPACASKPCAPDPVEKGGAGCSTGACEPLSEWVIFLFFLFIFSSFFLRTTDSFPLSPAHRHASGKSPLQTPAARPMGSTQWR